MQPTLEQELIRDHFRCGDDLVVTAGAGSGKTTTLLTLAEDNPHMHGFYLAYTKATAAEAGKRFPQSVECMTAHGLAMRAVGHRYRHRLGRQIGREVADHLGIQGTVRIGGRFLPTNQLASIAVDTVSRYCTSADPDITEAHVPVVRGLEDATSRAHLAHVVLPWAGRVWDAMRRPDGQLPVSHDFYLKLWSLSVQEGVTQPLPCQFLLYDEVQDADAAVAAAVALQTHVQRVVVGDPNQALFQFRNTVDATRTFSGTRLTLSKSFRFGPAIAEAANLCLDLLGAELRLIGHDPIRSTLGPLTHPKAILCRTNAQVVAEVMTAIEAGHKVAMARGADEIQRLAEAAISLQAGRGANHRDLRAFRTWGELQMFVEDEAAGADLEAFVRLIDRHTPEGVLEVIASLSSEQDADVVGSTAHNAKGLEWDSVLIPDGFPEPSPDRPLPPETLMLIYVALTRARLSLDPRGLPWLLDDLTPDLISGVAG